MSTGREQDGGRAGRRRAGLLPAVLVAGVVLAVGAPLGWAVTSGGPDQYGTERAAALATAEPERPVAPAPSAAPVVVAAGPVVQTRSALVADVVRPADPPVSLRVGGREVPVDPVGLDRKGQVRVPADVRRAGWWAAGPQPGSTAGSAVVVGHVDDREQGLGSFAVLRGLPDRAPVTVTTRSGAVLAYEVVAVEQIDKRAVPDRVFDAGGAPRLTLISCGGPFDRATGRYRDNVVVTAVPLP